MLYNELGNTGIKVSQLAFGSLTLSPLQKNLSYYDSRYLIDKAVDYGINFFDTSEFYQNYDKLRALNRFKSKDIVIASKSYAYDEKTARRSVEKALKELGRDYLDIFCLHEQESKMTLRGHERAFCELEKMKEEGLIRAIGISTHFLKCMKAVLDFPAIEIVQAITNYQGLGIVDGTREEMEESIEILRNCNVAVYGMKIIGGGSFHNNVLNAFNYVKNDIELDAFALGFGNEDELEFAYKYFYEDNYDLQILSKLNKSSRILHIAEWCTGCANCVHKCSQYALKLVDAKAQVKHDKCILCGYCIGVCPDFCIKIY